MVYIGGISAKLTVKSSRGYVMQNHTAPLSSKSPKGAIKFRFLRLPEVLEVTGLSRSQAYRLLAAGKFPNKVKLGDSEVSGSAWLDTEIAQWQADRVAASRGEA